MVRYGIFERRTDKRNQVYLVSVGTMQADNVQDAIRKLEDAFTTHVDESYMGGELYLAAKTAFNRIGLIKGWVPSV